MIQDIGTTFDRTFAIRTAAPTDPVICCRPEGVCAVSKAPLVFPTAADFAPEELTYLFRVGEGDYYLARRDPGAHAVALSHTQIPLESVRVKPKKKPRKVYAFRGFLHAHSGRLASQ